MIRTCLCLVRRQTTRGPEVLLGLKKTGFGAGKWVGLGGHVEPGEKPVAAAVREVEEESGLLVPAESDEVAPRWFAESAVPLGQMWHDARYWLPLVLAGEHVDLRATFAADCATVATLEPDLLTGRR